jgi:flagellum-specific peptidoglycan hydrolase FlgJ
MNMLPVFGAVARPKHVQDFIDKILPYAQRVRLTYKVPVSVTIAQAALETGWGSAVRGNAYFGIKGTAPTGASGTFTTQEEVNKDPRTKIGTRITIKDRFRAYADLSEAAMDYGLYLSTNKIYAEAFKHTDDPMQFADAVARAGYATAHDYGPQLKSIIAGFKLTYYDVVPISFAGFFW